MAKVWLRSDRIRCVHPGWRLLLGWNPVMESWAAIFKNTHRMQFILTEVSIDVMGDLGIVSCIENIVSESGQGDQFAAVQATNLFLRLDQRWQMILHHASGMAQHAATE